MSTEFKKWDTFRTVCGNGRITYHPDWSPNQPWASYWRGSAGLHFHSVPNAQQYFQRVRGTRLDLRVDASGRPFDQIKDPNDSTIHERVGSPVGAGSLSGQ